MKSVTAAKKTKPKLKLVKSESTPSGVMSEFPPGMSPRPWQGPIIEEVAAAFDGGKRFVVLEAPTGFGKTVAAVTLARYFGKAWICTLTKQLQAQYSGDFERIGARELKGRAAFKCERAGSEATCEEGGILFTGRDACGVANTPRKGKRKAHDEEDIGDRNPCPYRVAKAQALGAPLCVANYHSYIWNVGAGSAGEEEEDEWERPLLILDEGHEVESVLMDFIGVQINVNSLPFVMPEPLPPKDADTDAYFAWMKKLIDVAKTKMRDGGASIADIREKTKFERLLRKVGYVLSRKDKEEWVAEREDRDNVFALKPLTVASFGDKIFQYGQRVLIMSATILDGKKLCQSLGIDLNDAAFVNAPCVFPVENRRVIVGKLDMTKAARDESWPIMVKVVEAILKHHASEKGLILAPSNEMLKYIFKNVDKRLRDRLVLAFGEDRVQKYQEHLVAKHPTVLCGSGIWEGVDLKDDLSRFTIIPAVPRPYWGGQIAARAKLDPVWYRWLTYCQLLQGAGRSVRNETDSAITYVLDKALRAEAERPNSMLPGWFKEALVYHDG